MKRASKVLIFASVAVLTSGLEFPQDGSRYLALVGDAHAIIGAPLTPVSYAGVARRTTRRAVVVTSSAAASTASASTAAAASASQSAEAAAKSAEASAQASAQASAEAAQAAAASSAAAQSHGGVPIGMVVPALPQGCTSVTVSGKNYSDCGGSYYQAAIQGNNLVFVVVPKPMP